MERERGRDRERDPSPRGREDEMMNGPKEGV
jgi:hypothetical protein